VFWGFDIPLKPCISSFVSVPVTAQITIGWLLPLTTLGIVLAAGLVVLWRRDRLYLKSRLRQRDRELAALQRRMAGLCEILPELIVETDRRGVITFMEGACVSILGRQAAELDPDYSISQLIQPDQRDQFMLFFKTALAADELAPAEFRLRRPDGTSVPCRIHCAPVSEGRGGKVSGLRAVLHDIRPEIRSRKALDHRQAVEVAITDILKSFAGWTEGDLDQALTRALESIADLTTIDRCIMVRILEDGDSLSWDFQWHGEGIEPVPADEVGGLLQSYPWVGSQLSKGRTVHLENIRSLPESAQMERDRWARLGTESVLSIPLFAKKQLIGALSFHSVRRPGNWHEDDVRLLSTMAGIMADAMQRRAAQLEQDATHRRLVQTIEFLPDATFVIDAERRIVAWNRAMEELTGVPKEEMLGQGDYAYSVPFYGERIPILIDHFGDADLGSWRQLYNFVEINKDTLYAESFVPFLNDGKGAYLWLTASPLYDCDGNIVGAIESLRDITYRKRSEEALRHSEERYRRLVETMNDGVGVIGPDGSITYVNDRICAMTGFTREELLGQRVDRFLPDLSPERVVDEWPGWNLPQGEALEMELPCKNGRILPVRISPAPIHDRAGEFQGGFAIIADMTSIREAETRIRRLNEDLEIRVIEKTRELLATNRALRRSEARFRRIIENLREGFIFYAHDTRGEFTYISPSYRDVLGYATLEEALPLLNQWLELPENADARLCSEQSALGLRQRPYDLEVIHKDGSRRVLEILEVPVFDESGAVISVEGLGRDVTADRRNLRLIREAQQHLVESEKMAALGSLVAGLSHEINTPVGIGVTAISHLDQMAADCRHSYVNGGLTRSGFEQFLASTGETVDLIQTNLNRAADLLQNFKLVATDQSASKDRVFDVGEYLDDIIRSLSPRFRNTGFSVSCSCPADLQLRCDPGALYQIITNLVMNSLAHGFDGLLVGAIRIEVHAEHDQVIIEYSDTGIGMSARQLARIYEPFYTTKRGRGGTGLGMHIVYNNVTQNLGGNITCHSKPGKGVLFRIAVPLLMEVEHG